MIMERAKVNRKSIFICIGEKEGATAPSPTESSRSSMTAHGRDYTLAVIAGNSRPARPTVDVRFSRL